MFLQKKLIRLQMISNDDKRMHSIDSIETSTKQKRRE